MKKIVSIIISLVLVLSFLPSVFIGASAEDGPVYGDHARIAGFDVSLEYGRIAYDGTAKEPSVTIRCGSTIVTAIQITVTYLNNVDVGTATARISGLTQNPVDLTFQILPADFLLGDVDGNGTLQSMDIQLLKLYLNGSLPPEAVNNAIKLYNADFDGDGSVTWDDAAALIIEMLYYAIPLSSALFTTSIEYTRVAYDGTAKEPAVSVVTTDNIPLRPNVDYSVSYSNNTDIGTATVTVSGIGRLSGSVNLTFEILPADFLAGDVDGNGVINALDIHWIKLLLAGHTNLPVVMYNADVNGDGAYTLGDLAALKLLVEANNGEIDISDAVVSLEYTRVAYSGDELEPEVSIIVDGVDVSSEFGVSYSNNINVGTATVTITGGQYFTGTTSLTFEILPADFLAGDVDGNGVINALDIHWIKMILVGYTNIPVLMYNADVNGDGSYNARDLADLKELVDANNGEIDISDATVSLTQTRVAYTGEEIEPVVNIIVDGVNVSSSYSVRYSNNTDIGTATVTITGGQYFTGTTSLTFEIMPADFLPGDVDGNGVINALDIHWIKMILVGYTNIPVLMYNADVNGDGSYNARDLIDLKELVDANNGEIDISDAVVSLEYTRVAYSGDELEPEVSIIVDGVDVSSEFNVDYYNNTDIGTATVVISGGYYFTGTMNINYTILPADFLPGDIYLDGAVNYYDADLLRFYLNGQISPAVFYSITRAYNADVNGDGLINWDDHTALSALMA